MHSEQTDRQTLFFIYIDPHVILLRFLPTILFHLVYKLDIFHQMLLGNSETTMVQNIKKTKPVLRTE